MNGFILKLRVILTTVSANTAMRTTVLCALLCACVVLCVCVLGEGLPSRLVTTAQGPVRGYKDPDYDVFVFYSIPYATAPTGRNKFKAPLPPPVWEEPLEAVNKEIICPQINLGRLREQNVQEDCLIANVYVPDTNKDNIPVVLYVHSGGYIMGFGDMVNPRPLVNTKKVIIVTFNYRLAGHGFLCLGTEDIPGNAGSKDQVAMLRWVKKNIASFGGNPDDVTIIGSSAGSSSTDLLMISKMTKGLFNKVVPESGANTAAFSVQTDPIKSAKEYAKLLRADINVDDIYELEEYFKSLPVEKLNSVFTFNTTDSTTVVSPCIERDIGQEIFLEDSPVNILKSGNYPKVPMLYGFTNMEGLLRVGVIGDNYERDIEEMNRNFSNYLPADLHFENKHQREEVANMIKEYFFDKTIDKEDILDYINYFSDVLFVYSTLRAVKLHLDAGHNQIYLYEYSFTDENTPPIPFTKVRGAAHYAQSAAVWGPDPTYHPEENTTEEYEKLRQTLREIWLNFIITGNPRPEGSALPEWPPVGRKRSPHMSFGKAIELQGPLHKERTRFWDEIYAKYYRSPQPPPRQPSKRIEL